MRARAIMILGTSSHVGKSLLTAALCRILADDGYNVAPFKSQNMSLNSAATVEGLEIGRAQALQAEAARIPPSVDMNPILLKPAGDMTSQIVVRGKIWGQLSAYDYHLRRVEELLPIIRESYEALASRHEIIVLEGAGSPAEINLKKHDIVNMRMAEMADATCILVGDIDRGGVFASLLGTVELLDPFEQDRIQGFIINKFRGDASLLDSGIRMIEERLEKTCLGIVPYLPQLSIDEEDSLGLPTITDSSEERWHPTSHEGGPQLDRPLRIAVVALPSFSNFTDFDALRSEASVSLHFCRTAKQLSHADVIVLPGSKQTVDDLAWMREHGLDAAVLGHALESLVVGICGGMQMLGVKIVDPNAVEHSGDADGLNLLKFSTRMNSEKVTTKNSGCLATRVLFGQPISSVEVTGYEIHIGETEYAPASQTFATLSDGKADGCISRNTRIFGTYLHGIFDDDAFRHIFISAARAFHQLNEASKLEDWKHKREASLDRLAKTVRESLDLSLIREWIGPPQHLRFNDLIPEQPR